MANFTDYCQTAEDEFDRSVRSIPLVWEHDGDHVVDRMTNERFLLAEAMIAVSKSKVDHMGDGMMVWFGDPIIRIHFGTKGNA